MIPITYCGKVNSNIGLKRKSVGLRYQGASIYILYAKIVLITTRQMLTTFCIIIIYSPMIGSECSFP